MKNQLLILAAAGFAALSLTACSSSSTSTSTITVNGKTTTTTTITENGKTTTTTVTEVAAETADTTAAADTPQAEVAAEAADPTEAAGTEETVENMYLVNREILQEGLYRTDVYTSQIPLDGCDTFTDVVDKNLGNGQAYANITLDGTDVLLLSDDAFEFDGTAQAVSAEVFYYNEGTPAYAGFVRSGGSANPLMINDGKLYAAGHHYVGRFTMRDGQVVIDGEAFVTYDIDGNPTWHYNSDDGSDYTNLDQDSAQKAFDDLFDEYAGGEIVEFSIVNK